LKVRRAVITAAGWGTRFLPITRSQPKEMLPLVDKPLIQYGVEEAISSGIEQFIMVTSINKRAIEDYFDHSTELENFLERQGETVLLEQMKKISSMVNICYVRQKEQLGLGHALLTAKNLLDDEPFALILPDDIIESKTPTLKKMIDIYVKLGGTVVAVEKIDDADTKRYGIIKPEKIARNVYQVFGLVEKPTSSAAPSRLGIIGRYVLSPRIFEILEKTRPGKGGEIQLTDALQGLLKHEKMFAYEIEGIRHDAGTPLGWLKANITLGLKNKSIGAELKKYLKTLPG
jgi:UTP--glucose-1-phosphate uridylyltransferase